MVSKDDETVQNASAESTSDDSVGEDMKPPKVEVI
ncbi:hypothetical protein RCCS2_15174 [Roseobacter sp. CCS2]|nr:hypothetical protein RCCS2_15174 [Roseobacter sp. CCS2]